MERQTSSTARDSIMSERTIPRVVGMMNWFIRSFFIISRLVSGCQGKKKRQDFHLDLYVSYRDYNDFWVICIPFCTLFCSTWWRYWGPLPGCQLIEAGKLTNRSD